MVVDVVVVVVAVVVVEVAVVVVAGVVVVVATVIDAVVSGGVASSAESPHPAVAITNPMERATMRIEVTSASSRQSVKSTRPCR